MADSSQRYAHWMLREIYEQPASLAATLSRYVGDTAVGNLATHTISIEATGEPLTALCEVIPFQLLAYHVAVQRGTDVDNPRNLTKAVLVE